jgi:anaerobic ribonucleoside-triphosphate reductase activating protein
MAWRAQAPAARDEALAVPWRVHTVEPLSRANGPGVRFVIWSQGCALGCPGCFNPDTHPAGHQTQEQPAGQLAAAAAALAGQVEGVTLTGGEPLQQPEAVAAFGNEVKARADLGIIMLSGYTRAEIESDQLRLAAVASADMVIAGRYNRALHLGSGLRGSANKQYWARTGRYRAEDFGAVPDLEIAVAG